MYPPQWYPHPPQQSSELVGVLQLMLEREAQARAAAEAANARMQELYVRSLLDRPAPPNMFEQVRDMIKISKDLRPERESDTRGWEQALELAKRQSGLSEPKEDGLPIKEIASGVVAIANLFSSKRAAFQPPQQPAQQPETPPPAPAPEPAPQVILTYVDPSTGVVDVCDALRTVSEARARFGRPRQATAHA
jgi:hypothetical protein